MGASFCCPILQSRGLSEPTASLIAKRWDRWGMRSQEVSSTDLGWSQSSEVLEEYCDLSLLVVSLVEEVYCRGDIGCLPQCGGLQTFNFVHFRP